MFLPMINNRNNRPDQKFNINDCNVPKEQFGLGIQVFKIQSSKGIETNPPKPKKIQKNIENPITEQPTVMTVKRTPILPSLSTDKKAKTGGLNDTFKDRKATVQKKKLVLVTDSIKQFEDNKHKPLQKKISSVQQVNKTMGMQQTNMIVSQKFITQKHFRSSFNTLSDFYERLQDRQTQNLKEIKRLRKAKENSNEEQLVKQLRLKQNKIQMVYDIVDQENFTFFDKNEEYDEFNLNNYVNSGYQFKFQDVQPVFQY